MVARIFDRFLGEVCLEISRCCSKSILIGSFDCFLYEWNKCLEAKKYTGKQENISAKSKEGMCEAFAMKSIVHFHGRKTNFSMKIRMKGFVHAIADLVITACSNMLISLRVFIF